MIKTAGEELFERYLYNNNIIFQREPQFNKKKPDYLIKGVSQSVICDVKDFEMGDIEKSSYKAGLQDLINNPFLNEKEKLKLVNELKKFKDIQAHNAGTFDPQKKINSKLKRFREQINDFKNDYPCVIVFYNSQGMPYTAPLILESILLNLLQSNKNTCISAIATLEQKFKYDGLDINNDRINAEPYLIIYNNQFATTALLIGLFNGRYDEYKNLKQK